MEAYVLVKINPGEHKSVLQKLRAIDEVVSAHAVAGPYDVIAHIKCNDLKELGEIVCSKMHTIEGLQDTITCIVVEI